MTTRPAVSFSAKSMTSAIPDLLSNSEELNNLGFDQVELDRYLTHLEQLNLITMKALRFDSGIVNAMIQITPYPT